MPKPFRELSIEQFAELLDLFPFQRRIDTVHLHHTFRPNHTDFERRAPIESIEGMWRFHTTPEPDGRGWSDIAQHLTIDPRGVLWTGRSWDRAPASATGFNGNEDVGPFMIEMIGNFDRNADPFRDPQRRAAVQAIAAIQRRFGLPPEAIRFHNEMSKKTCPGTQVNKSEFISLLQEEHAALGREVSTNGGVFGPEATLRREAARNLVEALGPSTRTTPSTDHGELPDELLSHGELAFLLGEQEPTRSVSASRGPRQLTPQEKEILRRHVVNLRFGAFSDDGQFETSDADVNHIFDVELPHELERRRALGQKLKLVFFAHGGLVDELSGLLPILSRLDFWRSNGTYPIFFVWETGLRETITDIVRGLFTGRRGVFEDLNDAFIEALAREPGKQVWSQMKRSAEVSVLAGGGALFVIEKLLGFWNANHAEMEVHAVGHSAGSIFHAHFLDTLLRMSQNGQALKVDTLHFLAPAITTQLFHQRLAPHVHDANKIGRLTMYTMNRSLERDDRAGPYRKSLLYLVSRAFEPVSPTPILGLEDSIRADRSLVQLFGLDGGGAKADLLFSTTNGASARNSTTSKSHGDFDNDVATMNSVMRRILGVADATPITNFRNEGESRGFAVEPPQEAAPPMVAIPQPPPQPATIAPAISTTNGRRIALCIGVDEYPPGLELSGCVNDAENWSRTLNRLGFETMTIRNHQATRSGILGRINDLLTSLRAGDTAVIQ
ncbi:MAG TPA: N-acetylmuramoyl-L-alanine amidase [Bryobacteraceae bacterium]|nr:N-acetylmuramoyl-L-alanine amidase [Bryobacteraceae bacterium]